MARIPGQELEGRGTLCSLSALTNMLLRGDAAKILRPSGTKSWESEDSENIKDIEEREP